MYILSGKRYVVLRVLAVQYQISCRNFDRMLRDGARHSESAIVAHDCADRGAGLDAVGGRIAKSNFLENPEDILDDLFHSRVVERPVLATGLTRMNRLDVFRERRASERYPCFSSTRSSSHVALPLGRIDKGFSAVPKIASI